MELETLAGLNPGLDPFGPDDVRAARYARPLRLEGIASLLAAADAVVPFGLEANAYVASSPELEALPAARAFDARFGFIDLQVGWNAGPNSTVNGLEWHKSAEVLVAVEDLALFLGRVEDLER
ncbi:MAG: DUF4867 family protein, partial [Spirochaetaceae bacterium]|nr:DUF4867 family protein [Spirochaetaceae bacterium]